MAKKTVKCVPWLTQVLSDVLPTVKRTAVERQLLFGRPVNIVDGSCVKQQGEEGETLRIHMNYSLTGRFMEEVTVTDNHTAESFAPFVITPGSIYMADAGYGRGKNLDYIVSHQADAILRATPSQIALAKDSAGKEKIDMATVLDTCESLVDFQCYIRAGNKKYIPVRVIASRLPEDKIAKAIKRKKRNATKHQSVLRAATLVYAQWVVLLTSLPESCCAYDILKLYRTRWQVELLFKRIKQFAKITKIKAATIQHSTVLALLWLISWAVTERDTAAAEAFLIQRGEDVRLHNQWSLCGYFFHSFKASVYCLLASCSGINNRSSYIRLKHHNSNRPLQLVEFYNP